MDRKYIRLIFVLLTAAGASVGAWALISWRQRNYADAMENAMAESETFDTIHCLSACIDNYIAVHRAVPWSVDGEELWKYRMTAEGESSSCEPSCEQGVVTLRDGWGRNIRMVLGPEKVLWLISAGEDGIFQTDFKTSFPWDPRSAENDDMNWLVLSTPISNSQPQ